jgi:hypothetical protein
MPGTPKKVSARDAAHVLGDLQAVWGCGRSAEAISVGPVAIRRAAGRRRVGEVAGRRVCERPVVLQRVICDQIAGGVEEASARWESPAALAVGIREPTRAGVYEDRRHDAVGALVGHVVLEHEVVLSAGDVDAGTEEHLGCVAGRADPLRSASLAPRRRGNVEGTPVRPRASSRGHPPSVDSVTVQLS